MRQYLRPMARPFRIDFGCATTEITAGARLHYSSAGKIVKAWEKANSRFNT